MIVGLCFIWASALLLNICTADEVSRPVVGVIGGSVVLPCSPSSEEESKIQDSVHWRHNNSNVYDIIKGKASVEDQDSNYKNRTESFPGEYEKGNFSLKLSNLTHADAGVFQCFLDVNQVNVHLKINEPIKENQPAKKGNGAAETKLMWINILIPVLFVFLVLCI